MFYSLAVTLYVLVSFFLIIVVLLQPGKGDGMGAAFGGSSTGSVFGGRGASSVLTKMTTGSAVLFMLLSVLLARSSADHTIVGEGASLPAVPGATAPVTGGDEGAAEEGAGGDKAPAAEAKPAVEATQATGGNP